MVAAYVSRRFKRWHHAARVRLARASRVSFQLEVDEHMRPLQAEPIRVLRVLLSSAAFASDEGAADLGQVCVPYDAQRACALPPIRETTMAIARAPSGSAKKRGGQKQRKGGRGARFFLRLQLHEEARVVRAAVRVLEARRAEKAAAARGSSPSRRFGGPGGGAV